MTRLPDVPVRPPSEAAPSIDIFSPFRVQRESVLAAIGAHHFVLFVAAVETVIEAQKFSIPLLKSALSLSSGKARMVCRQLEAQGVISARRASGRRDVLIAVEDLALLLLVLRA